MMSELDRLVTHAVAKARLRLNRQSISSRVSRSSGRKVEVDGERNAVAQITAPVDELWEDIFHSTGLSDRDPVHLELLKRRWMYRERLIDLADELGINQANARSIVHRARKRIRERYPDCLSRHSSFLP